MSLENKVALVTGGSRGLGRSIALKLASLGANVVINYERNADAAAKVVEEIEEMGVKGLSLQCNVTDFDSCEELVKKSVETFGKIDILVNNAGITNDKLLLRMGKEDFTSVLDVNLTGAFNCTKHVVTSMIKNKIKGKIVNISSVVGVLGNPSQANYASSKAGLIGLTKAVARELGGKGICVNAVAPGYIATDMTDVLSDSIKEKYKANIPLKRFGKPEEVAEVVAFLTTSQSDYITGQVISCDGGMAM